MFFRISHNHDLNIIGYYPQTDIAKGYNPISNNGHRNVKRYEFPDFVPNYELELHPKAKATSLLPKVGPSFGLVVDGNFKEILSKHKLPPHHFYKIKVYQKDRILDYYWFHYIVDDFWEFVDKEKSYGEVYSVKRNIYTIYEKVNIISKDQIIELRRNLVLPKMFSAKTIMKTTFPNYDLYETELTNTMFLSAKLKLAIEEAGLTGMVIKPYDKVEIQD